MPYPVERPGAALRSGGLSREFTGLKTGPLVALDRGRCQRSGEELDALPCRHGLARSLRARTTSSITSTKRIRPPQLEQSSGSMSKTR
jgi:hypothetical protein